MMTYSNEEPLEPTEVSEIDLNQVAMQIILHSGSAKTLADEAFQLAKEKKFKDEVIVLAAGSIYSLTDEQLCDMFADNHVILEGQAAKLLIDRGLGYLIGASGSSRAMANAMTVGLEGL